VGTRDKDHLTVSEREIMKWLSKNGMSMMDMLKEYINHADK